MFEGIFDDNDKPNPKLKTASASAKLKTASASANILSPLKTEDIDVVAAIEEEEKYIHEMSNPPSIITILIISHGLDLPHDSYNDNNVRMVSFAGRTGSVYYANPHTLENINNIFKAKNIAYNKQLPFKGKKKFLETLYNDIPYANKCRQMPNFTFNEDQSVNALSTYDFLDTNIVKGNIASDYRTNLEYNAQLPSGAQSKLFTEYNRPNPHQSSIYTYGDVTNKLTHRFHAPVMNKLYQFYDNCDPTFPQKTHFGIYVMDICNYDPKMYNSTINIGDELTSSRKQYNNGFLEHSSENNNVTLEVLVRYLHELGFPVINIIDVACRSCKEMDVPVEGALLRERMTEKEDLLSTFMNRAYGRTRKLLRLTPTGFNHSSHSIVPPATARSKTKKKRIRVGRHRSKSKSKSRSKRSVRRH